MGKPGISTYKITVLNWEKHNPKARPNHPNFMLSKRFLDDAKIQQLSPTGVLLFLSCLILRAESESSQFEVTSKSLASQSRVKPGSLQSQLDQLQCLQLLTFEKIDPFINRIEKKRIEKKGIEVPATSGPPVPIVPELNKQVWEKYRDAYQARYHEPPVRNATVNSQISSLAKRLGQEAPEVAAFFVSVNKAFYVSQLHPIGLCLKDAEPLRTQWATGRVVTQRESMQADDSGAIASQLQRAREGRL